MFEELSSDRKAAEEAIARLGTLVPGSEVSWLTAEELRDGYLDLKREHEVLQSERDDLDNRLKAVSQQLVALQEKANAAMADDYSKLLEGRVAELQKANDFLRLRMAAG